MDLLTVAICVALVFASIGAWLVFSFCRYRRYFQSVRRLLLVTGAEDIWRLPPNKLMDVDNVIRGSYFAREAIPVAAAKVGEVIWSKPGGRR
jgi:hypothetical protein